MTTPVPDPAAEDSQAPPAEQLDSPTPAPTRLTPAEQEAYVRGHEKFARLMVREWAGFLPPDSADYEDALQSARIGLWEAARRFDPSLEYSYRTYAGWCCRGQIQNFLRHRRRRGLRSVPPEGPVVASLDDAGTDAGGRSRGEVLAARPGPDSGARLDARALLGLVEGRRRQVLELVYLEGRTLQDVADRLGVSVQRVDHLRRASLRQIRESLGLAA